MEQEIRIAMDQFRKLVEEQQERARKLKENRDSMFHLNLPSTSRSPQRREREELSKLPLSMQKRMGKTR